MTPRHDETIADRAEHAVIWGLQWLAAAFITGIMYEVMYWASVS